MEEKLKILLLNLVYQELNLQKIEDQLFMEGVQPKTISFDDVSIQHVVPKYFLLANDIHLENLTADELQQLNNYMSNFDETNIEFMREFYQYLIHMQFKLLCPKIPDRYIYYGPVSPDNLVPTDSIVLKLHYVEFGDNYDEARHDEIEDIVYDIMNEIQDEVGPSRNLKISVIKCNEIDFGKIDDTKRI